MGPPFRRASHQQTPSQEGPAQRQRRQRADPGDPGQYGGVRQELGEVAAEVSCFNHERTPIDTNELNERESASLSAINSRKSASIGDFLRFVSIGVHSWFSTGPGHESKSLRSWAPENGN